MIQLSRAAIAEVSRMKAKHPNPNAQFRLGVQAGGCADWSYTLEFDEQQTPTDHVIPCGDMQILIDGQSWIYLDGLTLDYTEDLMGGGFQFHNPNATSNCGCGNSFTVQPVT